MKSFTRIINNPAFQLVILGILTVISRLPFQLDLLNSYDAINYALAISRFDVRISQPQSPGYLLYILIAKGINLFVNNPLNALYLESVIFSAFAVMAIFLAGKEIYNPQVGLIASLFLATNAFFWCFSVIPSPYTGDFFASALIGWLCFRLRDTHNEKIGLVAGFCMGLIAGYRLQTLILLFPIFVYALWELRSKPAFVGFCLLVCFGIAGIFFLATILLSGGGRDYFNSFGNMVPLFKNTHYFTRIMLFLPRYSSNLYLTATYLFHAMGELLWIMILIGLFFLPNKFRFWKNKFLAFMCLWVVPAILLYFLVWPGNPGTILVCAPPFFILAAYGMERLLQFQKFRPYLMAAFLGILLIQILIFTISPVYLLGKNYRNFETWKGVKERVEQYKDRIALVKQEPVEGTVVFANDIRHLQYYLPEYLAFSVPVFQKDDPGQIRNILMSQDGNLLGKNGMTMQALLPAVIERLIFFDISPADVKVDMQRMDMHSQNGNSIFVLNISPGDCPDWTADGLIIIKCLK